MLSSRSLLLLSSSRPLSSSTCLTLTPSLGMQLLIRRRCLHGGAGLSRRRRSCSCQTHSHFSMNSDQHLIHHNHAHHSSSSSSSSSCIPPQLQSTTTTTTASSSQTDDTLTASSSSLTCQHTRCTTTTTTTPSSSSSINSSSSSSPSPSLSTTVPPSSSSSTTEFLSPTHNNTTKDTSTSPPPLEGSLIIGFTCNVCTTRQYKTMSKQAYHRGVVLIRCDGCSNLHLIADHLGWYDSMRHIGTLEDIMRAHGKEKEIRKVNLPTIPVRVPVSPSTTTATSSSGEHSCSDGNREKETVVRLAPVLQFVDGGGLVDPTTSNSSSTTTTTTATTTTPTTTPSSSSSLGTIGYESLDWVPKFEEMLRARDAKVEQQAAATAAKNV